MSVADKMTAVSLIFFVCIYSNLVFFILFIQIWCFFYFFDLGSIGVFFSTNFKAKKSPPTTEENPQDKRLQTILFSKSHYHHKQ